MFAALLREMIAPPSSRVPEPETMTGAQVDPFAAAGLANPLIKAAYTYRAAQIAGVIGKCDTVLDLGCGPATQLAMAAAFCPKTRFTGLDTSSDMLATADRHVQDKGLKNVTLAQGDMTALPYEPESFDGVISTMTLHHLSSEERLDACFGEIARVLKPGGRLYLTDFLRPRTEAALRLIVDADLRDLDPVFIADYENSLRAAFTFANFKRLTKYHFAGDRLRLVRSWPLGFLVVLRSKGPPAPDGQHAAQHLMDAASQAELEQLKTVSRLFRLADPEGDPFREVAAR